MRVCSRYRLILAYIIVTSHKLILQQMPLHKARYCGTCVYDSESDVKKMAVGHHLSERSHTIERSHNLLSGKRVERQDFVNLEEGGSEWVWDQGGVEIWMWDWRGEWVSAHLGLGLGLGPEGVRWVFVSGDSAPLH